MDSFELESAKDIAKELGKRVKSARKSLKKTQRQFAEFSGIAYGTYVRFEKTGQLSIPEFIVVMQRLNRVEELEGLLIERSEIKW